MRPLKYKNASDWRRVYEMFGPEAAGRPPKGTMFLPSSPATSRSNELPVAPPMIFGGAVERPEAYEARQRQQRVARLLKKNGIGQKPGPWWR